MNLSERPSRVTRGSAGWQPLRLSTLAGVRARTNTAQAADHDRGRDHEARIAAAFQEGLAEGRYQANAEAEAREKELGRSAGQHWSGLLDGLARGIGEI